MKPGNVQDCGGYYTRIGSVSHRTYSGHTVDIWCCESLVEDWSDKSQDIWWTYLLCRTYGVVADIWCGVSPSRMAAKVPPRIACTHAQ